MTRVNKTNTNHHQPHGQPTTAAHVTDCTYTTQSNHSYPKAPMKRGNDGPEVQVLSIAGAASFFPRVRACHFFVQVNSPSRFVRDV